MYSILIRTKPDLVAAANCVIDNQERSFNVLYGYSDTVPSNSDLNVMDGNTESKSEWRTDLKSNWQKFLDLFRIKYRIFD